MSVFLLDRARFFWRRRPYVFRRPLILFVLAYAAVLAWREDGREPVWPERDPARFAAGEVLTLMGRVSGEPEGRGEEKQFILEATEVSVPPGDECIPIQGRVKVRVADPGFLAGWGDVIRLQGKLSLFSSPGVPGAFDPRLFWARRAVHSQMFVPEGRWEILRSAPAWHPVRWIRAARRRCLAAFDENLSPPAAALLAGLALGKKPYAFPEMDEDFRRSGTYHLMVASGSNVGFALALWYLLARWGLGLPRRLLWAGAIPCAWLYAGVAGMDPPVVRAAVMVTFGILALMLGREDRLEHAVALAAGAMLLVRPQAFFEVGFQMSFAATLGVVMGAASLEAFIPEKFGEKFAPARWGLALLFAGVSAQFALAPILLHNFHRFSWIGLAANLIAVPWTGVCLVLSVALAAADGLLPATSPLLSAVSWPTEKAVLFLWDSVRFFAGVPGGEWIPSWGTRQTVLLSVLVILTFILTSYGRERPLPVGAPAPSGRFRRWPWGVLAFFWLAGVPALYALGRPAADGHLSVVWLNVGLGDAVVVKGPAGRVTLVDGGDSQAGSYRVIPYLRSRPIPRLDRVILTHADPPHGGGLVPLFREFKVGEVLCRREAWDDPLWEEGRAVMEEKGIPHRFIQPGEAWAEDGVSWRVFGVPHPDDDPDEQNLVLRVTMGESVLLTGDIAPQSQSEILRQAQGPLSILQWPHHGRVLPDPRFLRELHPRWLVVSTDHPGDFVLSPSPSTELRVTGRDGTLEWRTDGHDSNLREIKE